MTVEILRADPCVNLNSLSHLLDRLERAVRHGSFDDFTEAVSLIADELSSQLGVFVDYEICITLREIAFYDLTTGKTLLHILIR